MISYPYSYFCGANVVIEIEGMPLLEVCGLRVSIMESKRPIYGYSSRHFDAIAAGQVLVEGALIINYVDQNYLFEAIRMGLEAKGLSKGVAPGPLANPTSELQDQLANEGNANNLLHQYLLDPVSNQGIRDAMVAQFTAAPPTVQGTIVTPNPHDSYGGLDLRVTFGDREVYNFYSGLTNALIQDLHFTGRSMPIAIDEQTIVEEFPFLARNIVHLRQQYSVSYSAPTANNDDTFTITK